MPRSPEELYAEVVAAVGVEGRLPLPETDLPWEAVDGSIVAKVLRAPVAVDATRTGREHCPICASLATDRTLWEDDRFFVSRMFAPSGLSIYFLQTKEHLDYVDMDDDLAAECGRLQVILCRIVERLDHINRVFVCRFQNAAEHMHVWFIAQPERLPQIRGWSALAWDDLLPPIPEDVVLADAREVARELATHGGRARV